MSDAEKSSKSAPMTDEERLALCQKLDKELDEFIDSLDKKGYDDGWPEDRWEEEMDKHPFFMKSTPQDGELSPLAEGLAKLKYDPDENTPLELANNYKEDGNFNFKHKNYRLAVLGYTEGIKIRCDNAEINASLYNNRAASHWFLKNYRSALLDSQKALTFDPNHAKACIRAARAAFEGKKYDICIKHCEKYLENTTDKEVTELLNKAKKGKMVKERDERKKDRKETKTNKEKDELIKTIVQRGIKISNCDDEDDIDLSKLKLTLPEGTDAIVHIENGVLMWPILLLYPEFQLKDYLIDCAENTPLVHHLEQLFPAPWDVKNEYKCSTINIYYQGYDQMPHLVDPNKNLGDILVSKYFELSGGSVVFFVVPRGSVIEKSFILNHL